VKHWQIVGARKDNVQEEGIKIGRRKRKTAKRLVGEGIGMKESGVASRELNGERGLLETHRLSHYRFGTRLCLGRRQWQAHSMDAFGKVACFLSVGNWKDDCWPCFRTPVAGQASVIWWRSGDRNL